MEKKPFRIRDRKFELGLGHVNAGFANNFLTTKDIFQEIAFVDLSELKNDLEINLDVFAKPFYFNFQKKNRWGFGVHVSADAAGILDLSGDMLTLGKAEKSKSDVSGAAFVNVNIPTFFHVQGIKIKFAPSVYYPLMCVEPDVSYTQRDVDGVGIVFDLNYNLRVYTPMPFEDGFSLSNPLTASPGIGFSLGVEYPLAEMFGLKESFAFLDFKIGVDFINIPVVPAKMNDYMELSGRIGSTEPIDVFDFDFDDFVQQNDTVYGEGAKRVFKPFKMLTWSDWKPFRAVPVHFISSFGFAVNPFYQKKGSIEIGTKARFDLANLFLVTFGVGYHDRLWKNSFDMVLNLRFFELNLGVDFRSQNFAKSWAGGGFAAKFGLVFGF